MAEGGGEFAYEDPNLDDKIDNDGDDDVDPPNYYDDDAVQNVLSETHTFVPGAASTPAPGGEQMQTMQDEHSGLPSYDVEAPLLGAQQQSWDALTRVFP